MTHRDLQSEESSEVDDEHLTIAGRRRWRNMKVPCMLKKQPDPASASTIATNGRLAEAVHLQAIKVDPLTTKEIATFELFERGGWLPEQRRVNIFCRVEDCGRIAAATKE